MKKEVVIAISIGVLIGLVFTYGIWLANKSLKQAGIKSSEKSAAITPTPSVKPEISGFYLTSPAPNLLTNQKTITVTGQHEPATTIVILTENSQYVIATSSAIFSQDITLDTGYNRLKVISVDSSGNQKSLEQLVTYSTTASLFSEEIPTATVSPKASPSGSLRDSVKEQVEKQLAEIKNNTSKKAYLDVYSKLSSQLIINPDTVVKLLNGSEGTSADLKPTDFILAMGNADGKGILTAKRILVVAKPVPDPRKVLSGSVSAFTNKTLTIAKTVLTISKATTFQPSSYKFKDIDPGFKIIAVHTSTSTPLIFVLSEK